MSSSVDVELLLRDWMTDGPTVLPDGVTTSVASAIARQPQRVVWRIRGAVIPASSVAPLAFAAMAVALIAVLGLNLIPRLPSLNASPSAVPAASASPSPTSAPTNLMLSPEELTSTPPPTTAVTPSPTNTAGPPRTPVPSPRSVHLTAGSHDTQVWQPTLTFTIPSGWTLDEGVTHLVLSEDGTGRQIDMTNNVYPPGHSGSTCGVGPKYMEVANRARDLVDFLTSPDLWGADATPVRLGGLSGWRVVGGVNHIDYCSLLYIAGSTGEPRLIGGPILGPLYILDDAGGNAFIIEIARGDATAESILETFRFDEGDLDFVELQEGANVSRVWKPTLGFSVPAKNWYVHEDQTALEIAPFYGTVDDGISVTFDVYPPAVDGHQCGPGLNWDGAHSPSDFVAFMKSVGGWSGDAQPITLGGLSGQQINGPFSLPRSCGVTYSVKWYDGVPVQVAADIAKGQSITLLDDGLGHTILLEIGYGERSLGTAEAIVSSFEFETP